MYNGLSELYFEIICSWVTATAAKRTGEVGWRTMETRGVECVGVDYFSTNWRGSSPVMAPIMNWGSPGFGSRSGHSFLFPTVVSIDRSP